METVRRWSDGLCLNTRWNGSFIQKIFARFPSECGSVVVRWCPGDHALRAPDYVAYFYRQMQSRRSNFYSYRPAFQKVGQCPVENLNQLELVLFSSSLALFDSGFAFFILYVVFLYQGGYWHWPWCKKNNCINTSLSKKKEWRKRVTKQKWMNK